MTRLFVLLILLTGISACKDSLGKSSDLPAVRDLILEKYFAALDSLPYSDTVSQEYKLIKAYQSNDTGYLIQRYAEITEIVKAMRQEVNPVACKEPLPINKLQVEEAYRFSYDAAFCDKAVTITIGKLKNSITLDCYVYQVDNRETPCKTISHFTKQLDVSAWAEIKDGVAFSDFWGLNEDNGRHGVDGSGLRVTGYQKLARSFEEKYKVIHRWAAESMAIGKVFKKVLALSGQEIACFH